VFSYFVEAFLPQQCSIGRGDTNNSQQENSLINDQLLDHVSRSIDKQLRDLMPIILCVSFGISIPCNTPWRLEI
jgi:hypothetical protein